MYGQSCPCILALAILFVFVKYYHATTSLAKSIVQESKFGDIAVMYEGCLANISNCHIVTGILILIGSLRCLEEESQWTRSV